MEKYGPQFPTLQTIARDTYAMPISTVAYESTFSMGSRLISPQRNRLHLDLIEALACAQNWFKAELEGKIFKYIQAILILYEPLINSMHQLILYYHFSRMSRRCSF